RACETISDRFGGLYLSLAETWLRRGQPQRATPYLERIVQNFPGSRQAEAAKVRLATIQGRPTWQAEFKKGTGHLHACLPSRQARQLQPFFSAGNAAKSRWPLLAKMPPMCAPPAKP